MEERNPSRISGPATAAGQANTPHLTDDQFTDLLLGAVPPDVAAHLAVCARCEQEAAQVSGAIGSFEQQSRLWAERRAWSTPLHSAVPAPLRTRMQAGLRLPRASSAWYAAAASLVLALGIGLAHRAAPGPTLPAAAHQAAVDVTPSRLIEDNALLSAIDGELSAEAAPLAAMYSLNLNQHHGRARTAKGIAN